MKQLLFLFIILAAGCSEPPKDNVQPTKKQRVTTSDITFEFPVVIKAESLFKVDVKFAHNSHIKSAKLSGISMDMGVVPVMFRPINQLNLHYKADVFLGACALPIMKWRLELIWVENGKTKYAEQVIQVVR